MISVSKKLSECLPPTKAIIPYFFLFYYKTTQLFAYLKKLKKDRSQTNENLILDKNESSFRKKSAYLSSVYNSEDERVKKEVFEKNLADISDESYFMKIKEKSDSKKTRSSPYIIDYHQKSDAEESSYHNMSELQEKETESEVILSH